MRATWAGVTARPTRGAITVACLLALLLAAPASASLGKPIRLTTLDVIDEPSAAIGDEILFDGFDDDHGNELWKSDGTPSGTHRVADLVSGPASSYPFTLTSAGGLVFFDVLNRSLARLWQSDGSPTGTQPVDGAPNALWGTDVSGTLFFYGDDGNTGREPWKTDGTPAGTGLIADIYPGDGGSIGNFNGGIAFNGSLFFRADDGVIGGELWKSDGTGPGTQLVKEINPGPFGSHPEMGAVSGSTLFFSAYDGPYHGGPHGDPAHGTELWTTDGTAEGTKLVKDINRGKSGSDPFGFTVVGGEVFFSANDGRHGIELWKSDGTRRHTKLVRDIRRGGESSRPVCLTSWRGTLLFSAEGRHSREPWTSDGTRGGTRPLANINPSGDSNPCGFTRAGGRLLFAADDGVHGTELWKTDGTGKGTKLVSDIHRGPDRSGPRLFRRAGRHVFFYARDSGGDVALWSIEF